MNACLSEGTLQAYLDRELREPEMQSATAHLAACRSCGAHLETLRLTAARVDALLGSLAEDSVRQPVAHVGASRHHSWAVAAAVALAASILLVAVLARHPQPSHRTAAPKPAQAAAVSAALPGQGRQAQQEVNYFLPLDNEPMQIGTVVRVSLPASLFDATGSATDSEEVQAEVIVGDDGRARAIRFLQ